MNQDIWRESDQSLCEGSKLHLVSDGGPVTIWSRLAPTQTITDTCTDACSQTMVETALDLAPWQLVVVGRQEGGRLSYLDPSYLPTQMAPDSGRSVLKNSGSDMYVSRGHFTLRASVGGILLLNGVPGVDGGVRPPMNWTYLMEPVYRELNKGELLLVERGSKVKIMLPNSVRIVISAS